MELLFFWIILAIVVGVVAESRGRSGFGWVLLSALLISPLLGLILVLCLPNLKAAKLEQERHHQMLAVLAGQPVPPPARAPRFLDRF